MLPGTVLYVYLGSTVRELADLAAGNVERHAGADGRSSGSAWR